MNTHPRIWKVFKTDPENGITVEKVLNDTALEWRVFQILDFGVCFGIVCYQGGSW